MLEIDSLAVRYGAVQAVRGVSLAVGQGEIVGLVGPNGAGKTSLLGAIAGAVGTAGGSVSFEGRRLTGMKPEEIVRLGIALVPEGRHIFSTLSVAENLLLGTTPRKDGRSAWAEDTEKVLDRFPVLRRYYKQSAARLSGGEQQQLAIARALLSRPRLVLFDEPSLGLAPLVVDIVFDTIRQLNEEGVTVLLVEQNAMRTIKLAHRSYVLRNGSIALAGTRDEMLAQPDLASTYLGL